ncbi:conserved hypothetical protein [Perkinsus marinus ATCC 50983]|uniref:Aminomethyltransferase folate-binding domain-containing protein n=1 Tax=Perkinsus marinus (strain ATCC 50983 / TXsc) TaxID=423536 RepID=C5LQK7_PERM5|nr:conserved hypothetical protein [Perkinsus marinus ATCC 50983]EER00986.1 conserved hypothetical protein [Perkinsus marinus ATCC 50983]|eukprot:XP_002768268.1 conserved hypothetical protein [Perkinsus marinus ATCC 50983]
MEQSAAAAVFLSPKGRVLFDCLMYSGVSLKPDTSKGIVSDDKGEESLVVDVDEGVLDNVMRLFIRHRVHLPLNIEKLDNLGVYWTPSKSQNGCDGDTEVPVYEDPRVKDLGLRAILPKSDIDAESTEALYRRLRIGLVVPEGPNEMAPDKVLPLNYNLDLTNHIAFNKGCYIGQELTTRASKKLAVRKRLFGMRIDGDVDVESGAEIMCDGEKIGKVLELSSSEGDGDVLGIAQIHAPKGMQMNTKQAMVEATKKYLEDDHIYIEKDSTKIGVELGLPKYILS